MSDGREEREELKRRLEQEERENRKDWTERESPDQWEPERVDSLTSVLRAKRSP